MNEKKYQTSADKLIRSRRKTVSLEITPYAELIIRAPFWVSKQAITKIVRKKRNWILGKKEAAAARLKRKKELFFIDGGEFFFAGKTCYLNIVEEGKIRLNGAFLDFPRAFIKENPLEKLKKWYKKQAKTVIEKSCQVQVIKTGLQPKEIKISNARKRIASCGNQNKLSFSWRLIFAPPKVIDYVAIHELCHIKFKNHSREFWQQVDTYCPDYRKAKKWLKENPFNLYWPE